MGLSDQQLKAKLYLLNNNLAKCRHCSMIHIGEDCIAKCSDGHIRPDASQSIDKKEKCYYWTPEFHNWKKKYWKSTGQEIPKSDLERFLE